MHKRIVIFLAAVLPFTLYSSESFYSHASKKPALKLIKKEPGKRYKKIVIVKKNGERKVLVKVKKVRKTSPYPLLDEAGMITDTYRPFQPESNETEETNSTLSIPPDNDVNTSDGTLQDENQTIPVTAAGYSVQPPEEEPYSEPPFPAEETTDIEPHPLDPNLPASNWKRHYFTLAVGSSSRDRTTKVDTVNLGSSIKLENSDHTFLADGSLYEYDDAEAYAHVEAGYLFKPAIQGASLALSGYYDQDLIEFRGTVGYTMDEIASFFFPTVKIGGALTHDNGDDSDYDATAYFGGISLDRRLLNGMIIGMEYLYLQRQWLKKEEFFGTVTCEDRESALRLTLDIPLF